ncbi:MAG: nickel pincer cofactor biosynthesis protein LarB [candidate division Zixibacteria bacterium]|nr:nickel pincer cofactor biosynthesis protein LarB [candidate division Zixibacteria bacterium]
MDKDRLLELVNQIRAGKMSDEEVVERLKHLPLENLDFARIDHHRTLRRGQPEVIYAPGKTVGQIVAIAERIHHSGSDVIISRLDQDRVTTIRKKFRGAQYFPDARMAVVFGGRRKEPKPTTSAIVLVCSGGTSDIPVAEEAALTAWMMGCPVERLYDVGVAGIHRLFDGHDLLVKASVIVAVAGMEGALPSVVGGLVDVPVIAVPTSVGYGASLNGLAALLAMLNSCASGVTVVNIDNGFGAGIAAAMIARRSIAKG